MQEIHSSMCEPCGVNVDVQWCHQEHLYIVRSQWFEHGGWVDEQQPVYVARTTDIDAVHLMVRADLLKHKLRLMSSRRRKI